jgi:hypothetical protein
MATLIVVEDLAAPAVVYRGGQAALVLQFLDGLEALGHDVLHVEFLDTEPDADACHWYREVVDGWWHADRSALLVGPDWRSIAGPDREHVERVAARADALITIAAHYRSEPWPLLEAVRPRILVEQDPAYTHLWAAGDGPDGARNIFGEHDVYFTVGRNIGSAQCRVPRLGIDWHPMVNPVALDRWQPTLPPDGAVFSTVAGLRDYGWLDFEGQALGPKIDQLEHFASLPHALGEPVEMLGDLDPDDDERVEFEAQGWRFRSPEIVATPDQFRQYIASCAGEFSVAKGGYVGTRSGWFSDRSAAFLAAGRPVVLQATGFEDTLPTGAGLFAVHDVDEAVAAIKAIRAEPALHSAAARNIAEEHFDARVVLRSMLELAGVN